MRRYIFIQLFFLYVMMYYLIPIPIYYINYLLTGIFLVIIPKIYWMFIIGFSIAPDVIDMMRFILTHPNFGYDFFKEYESLMLSISLNNMNINDMQVRMIEESFWIYFEKDITKYGWILNSWIIVVYILFPIFIIIIFYIIARWLIKDGRGIKQFLK